MVLETPGRMSWSLFPNFRQLEPQLTHDSCRMLDDQVNYFKSRYRYIATVMKQLSSWIAHYNEVHPHKALGYRSPRELIAAHKSS